MLAVIGLGRVGLPLALCLASRGEPVIGVDVDRAILEALERGELPFPDAFAAGMLPGCLGRTFRAVGDLEETTDLCDTFVLTLGTPLGGNMLPVQEPIFEVAGRILEATRGREGLTKPPLVVIRSTVTPGTTDALARMASWRFGLALGVDFLLAVCPERTLEGHSEELLQLPQIIGSRDERSRDAAAALFGPLGVPLVFTGPVEAELAKLFNNAHRYVNFALANEFLMIARYHGANVFEALRAANEGYKRGGIPGPGFASGPCLYKDGFLLDGCFPAAELLLTSWRLNEGFPEYLIRQVELIRPLSRATVLGLAFKADSDDSRNAPGLKLAGLLQSRGIETVSHDPVVRIAGSTTDLAEALSGAGEVFVVVPHRQYREFPWAKLIALVRSGGVVADPWRVWGQQDAVTRL